MCGLERGAESSPLAGGIRRGGGDESLAAVAPPLARLSLGCWMCAQHLALGLDTLDQCPVLVGQVQPIAQDAPVGQRRDAGESG